LQGRVTLDCGKEVVRESLGSVFRAPVGIHELDLWAVVDPVLRLLVVSRDPLVPLIGRGLLGNLILTQALRDNFLVFRRAQVVGRAQVV